MTKKMRIATKLFIWLIIFSVIPMTLILLTMKKQYEDYISTEIITRITQNLMKSEQDLYDHFNRITNLSNIIISDSRIREQITNDHSYYSKVVAIDKILTEWMAYNVFGLEDMQITILSEQNQVFTNWSMNFNDYSFLYQEDWVQESINMKGQIRWILFGDAFIQEDMNREKYLGLARSILSEGVSGEKLGTLIVSVRQSKISKVLERYCYDELDCVYMCDEDNQIILRLDPNQRIISESETFLPVVKLQNPKNQNVFNIDGNQYLLSYYTLDSKWKMNGKRLQVYHFTNYQSVTRQFLNFSGQMSIFTILFIFAISIVVYIVIRIFAKPIRHLAIQMNQYKIEDYGRLKETLHVQRGDEIGDLNRSFYNMNENIHQLFEQIKKEQNIKEQYKINYLKAQLNPHFLFNTIGVIRWMAIIKKAPNIVNAIDSLSNVLKYSMGKEAELVSIRDELDMILEYVNIQNLRYGKSYRLQIEVDPKYLHNKILRFIMQPVIENAIIHGFTNITHEGVITINVTENNPDLILVVEDNGTGMSEVQLQKLNRYCSGEHEEYRIPVNTDDLDIRLANSKIGVNNINEQIKIRYGTRYGLSFEKSSSGGTRVVYMLPTCP